MRPWSCLHSISLAVMFSPIFVQTPYKSCLSALRESYRLFSFVVWMWECQLVHLPTCRGSFLPPSLVTENVMTPQCLHHGLFSKSRDWGRYLGLGGRIKSGFIICILHRIFRWSIKTHKQINFSPLVEIGIFFFKKDCQRHNRDISSVCASCSV